MLICRIIGPVVATIKHPSLEGFKLLMVQEVTDDNQLKPNTIFVAADMVGAGDNEVVVVVRGSNSCADGSLAPSQKRIPIDASIIGIVDSLSADGKITFKK